MVAYDYHRPGRYLARLDVLDERADPLIGARLRLPVHVRPAPVADAGAPVTVAPGTAVDFSGAGSAPSDSPITRWHWTFGDGATATGREARHAYRMPGEYRAVLRVEDDSGHPCNHGVATRIVTVNHDPVADAGPDRAAAVGEVLDLDGGASFDRDGAVRAWTWDMGDGTVLTGRRVAHAWTRPGTFTVTLTVRDD